MAQLETYSTTGLPPGRRIDYWNELTGNALTQLVADPLDRSPFTGRLTCTEVGQMRIANLYSDPAKVQHSRQHVAGAREQKFFLDLQLDGESLVRQQGREIHLCYGDFTLLDTSRPYEVIFERGKRMLVLSIPQASLRRRMSNPESVVALAPSGQPGLARLVSSFLRNFWQQRLSRDDVYLSPRLSEAMLDLVASVYTCGSQARPQDASLQVLRREQARGYIESHLYDPELTPGRIAAALRMSPRYLHHLFQDDNETVGRYVLRRRLEECAAAITDVTQRTRTVTEIAFHHGFNDPSHFARVFRERFGLTPREYRRLNAPD